MTATTQTSAGFDATLDVGSDLVSVLLRDEWTGFCLFVERTTHDNAFSAAYELIDEFLGDGFFNNQARTSGAHQSGIQESGIERIIHGGIEIGVSEDDIWVLTTKLESYLLYALCRGFCNLLAGLQTTGKGDKVNFGMGGKHRTDIGAVAHNYVCYTSWKTKGIQNISNQQRG